MNIHQLCWQGKLLKDLNKDELITIIIQLFNSNEKINDNFFRLSELNMRILEQNAKLLSKI